jgi:hypothetical protein
MVGQQVVHVFSPDTGSAEWSYITLNNKAEAGFTVSSVQLLGATKLNLHFEHIFFSPKKSDAENAEVIGNLASILKSVGAVNIKANVVKLTAVAQRIDASYDILDVPVSEVDKLTSTIAKVCKDLIEMLSM